MPPIHGIAGWIERRAILTPDRAAMVHGGTAVTYGELAHRVRRLAGGLATHGVGPGDRVGWLGANHPAFLELLFATARRGAILAPVNHRLDPDVVGSLLGSYGTDVVVVEQGSAGALPLDPVVTRRIVVGGTSGGAISYEQLVTTSSTLDDEVAVELHDVCLIPHTSGTTGAPKGVMLTHGNVTWNVVNLLSLVDVRNDDVTVAIAPFFRTGGTGVNVLPVLFKGGTVVVPESSEPDELVELLERHRVTIGFGNPDLLDALVHASRWRDADLSSLRCCITGGAPVPERLIHTYRDRGVNLLQGYGLSEASPFVLLLDSQQASAKVGAAGKPALFVDVRVVRDDGATSDVGETGELHVRGPNVMAGYWQDPEATRAAVDDDGWLHTGDAARVDADGDVWIVGRTHDAFSVAGHTVHPGDVERVLAEDPTVAEVAVVGPGESGAGMTAFVVLTAGAAFDETALLERCRGQLPAYAVPGVIRTLERLPRSTVGKLLRAELADLAARA